MAEGDADLVGGRVRIDAHVRVVAYHFVHCIKTWEEVGQFEGQALVVVVVRFCVVVLDERTSATVKLSGDYEGVANHSSLWVDTF